MENLWKQSEEAFPNSPEVSYWFDSWNPAELPIPDPPDFEVEVRGQDADDMALLARTLNDELRERKIFERTTVQPDAWPQENIRLRPKREQWPMLESQGLRLSVYQLAQLTRTATDGSYVGKVNLKDSTDYSENLKMTMRYPMGFVTTPEELGALPVGVGSRIVPLKAVVDVSRENIRSTIGLENGRALHTVSARGKKGEREETKVSIAKAEDLVRRWFSLDKNKYKLAPPTTLLKDAKLVLTEALEQLGLAVSLSIGLIFLTMIFQFGSVVNAALVLVSVPLGLIGVILSLTIFQSTLSLNSMLGLILLNGLVVANSIILVDFLQRRVKQGEAPLQAAVEVGRSRLRPILMTSLTTGLGMIPVALGLGEGGKILQPLGVAVAGGLAFSMITTLFLVPALQVAWLERSAQRVGHERTREGG
jgi:HAE1 family hydrophobic/amphiphilic exporter-1